MNTNFIKIIYVKSHKYLIFKTNSLLTQFQKTGSFFFLRQRVAIPELQVCFYIFLIIIGLLYSIEEKGPKSFS